MLTESCKILYFASFALDTPPSKAVNELKDFRSTVSETKEEAGHSEGFLWGRELVFESESNPLVC